MRQADSLLFRARAEHLPWATIGSRHRSALRKAGGRQKLEQSGLDERLLRLRSTDVHLTWACSQGLGVPSTPFMVWTRVPEDSPERVRAFVGGGDPAFVVWGGTDAGCVRVTCRPADPTRPVALMLMRSGSSVDHVVAAGAVTPSGPGPLSIQVRTSGATYARLVNGFDAQVSIEPLDDVVNNGAWEPLELVGLPADQPWGGTGYDPTDQGLVTSPVSPEEAAYQRLQRGGPPLGWWPVTESGVLAPPWQAPDPKLLVEEVRRDVLPEITSLYDGSTDEFLQWKLRTPRTVDGPTQDGRMSTLSSTADVGPWPMLMLPAASDPFLNLACGFGSVYAMERFEEEQVAVGRCDFLVTAEYRRLAPPATGGAEMAAYAPAANQHLMVPAPTGLTAERAGLVGPARRDQPWRESVRLSWDVVLPNAGTPPTTESSLARFELGTGQAESLLPERWSGGRRPFVISRDAGEEDGGDRTSLADGGVSIPIGGGGRHVGYAVAVSDVFGVWSTWQDVPWNGDEPGPAAPRLVSLGLSTRYAGSAACPATLETQVAVDWVERTPTQVEIVAVFFPMAAADSAPPAGLSPGAATPPGCFRRDLSLSFAGDVPVPSGCTVVPLNPDGDAPMVPGPGQGDGGRRYAVSSDVPTLDFGATRRWGVQVWARISLLVGASPTPWVPGAPHPAITSAASPVPVQPLPPPAPPGVPLGSTLDAQGCSHVRVKWSLPAGSPVRTSVVWEVAETSLRQRAGLPQRAPDSDSPGVRLAALWAAYDALSPAARRAAFRRLQEVPGTRNELDVTLPKGSTDIHLFLVTTMTTTGVESPWPTGPGAPHDHLQAVTAPRLRRPGPPLARPSVAADGTVTVNLFSTSAIPVQRFQLYRTRSEAAARTVDTMGPAFAQPAVTVTPSPTDVDPVLGLPVYRATWTGTLPGHWDPWLLRAVALPVDTVPVKAERGLPSTASDVASLWVPPTGPPDLDPLVPEIWGADHRGVLVRTSTSAPARAVAAGSHRLTATGGTQVLAATPLEDLTQTALTTPPAAAGTAVVAERGPRATGRSPLAVWFTRPVAADPVTVEVQVTDPFGRVTVRTVTVPGWTPPPTVDLELVRVTTIAGRGVSLGIFTDADAGAQPPYVLEVVARQRFRSPTPWWSRWFERGPLLGRTLSGSFPLDEIRSTVGPFPRSTEIQVVRVKRRRGRGRTENYDVWIPLTAPLSAAVSIVAPDGARVTVTALA